MLFHGDTRKCQNLVCLCQRLKTFCQTQIHGENIIMPPLKKGAYCFATVGRSVDQVLSAQYLLTPSLDQTKLGAGVALNE